MAERIRNFTGIEKCSHCLDDAQVLVSTRMDLRSTKTGAAAHGPYEEMGPCPYCERGFRLEFPEKSTGPWGPQGYWRGRDPQQVLA